MRWTIEKAHFSCIIYLWPSVLHALSFIADWRTVLITNQVDGWEEMPSFSSVLPESQDILSSFTHIDFLSVALIKIAVLQSNSLARNEEGINQLSVKYSNFIIVQNDYGWKFGSGMRLWKYLNSQIKIYFS